jgi:tRNA-Thr(GGU) m(6)t(6)A37 methyltransferase TsaA
MQIDFQPIGIIHSPFHDLREMPIQPSGETGASGMIEIYSEYAAGLQDLDGFSHIILLYYFHGAGPIRMTVTPFLDSHPHGVFATRAPVRPNPIGLSVVPLLKIEGNTLYVDHLDILDGTPLLDIKPYVPEFDEQQNIRTGWFEQTKGKAKRTKSDDRFIG